VPGPPSFSPAAPRSRRSWRHRQRRSRPKPSYERRVLHIRRYEATANRPTSLRGHPDLPQRGFPGAGAEPPRERRRRCARRARWRDVGSLLPCAASGRKAGRVRLLLRAHAGRRSRRAWIKWNAQTASVFLWGLLSPRRLVHGYRIDSCATATRSGSGRTSSRYSNCFVVARSTRSCPNACHSPKCAERTSCSRARRRRESSYSCQKALRTLADNARRPCWSRKTVRVRGRRPLDYARGGPFPPGASLLRMQVRTQPTT
jgi:hypothetical protein